MTVWIVMKNGKVDEVFDDETVAIHHYNSLIRKWSICEIIKKEVKRF